MSAAELCTINVLTKCSACTTSGGSCFRFPDASSCSIASNSVPCINTTDTCGTKPAMCATLGQGSSFTLTYDSSFAPQSGVGQIFAISNFPLPATVTDFSLVSNVLPSKKIKVDAALFTGATSLSSLTFVNVDYAALSLTDLPATVTKVTYDTCGITDVSKVVLGPGVTSVSLKGNSLPSATPPDWLQFGKVTSLDLTGCNLVSNSNSGQLLWTFPPKLTSLDLSGNSGMTVIPSGVFSLSLTTLKLPTTINTNLQAISSDNFKVLSSIKNLLIPSATSCADPSATIKSLGTQTVCVKEVGSTSGSSNTGLIVGVAVGAVVLIAAIAVFFYCRRKKAAAGGNYYRQSRDRSGSVPRHRS
ncbi:hypothetical protein As57867_009301, partial [Aphanomyces stellatus]